MPTSNTSLPSSPESDALPELIETGGGENIRYRGRLLYSERGPALFAERLAAAALAAEDRGPSRLYVLASPCLWHGVASLLQGLPEGSALLCIEADPALAAIARAALPRALAEDSRLLFAPRIDPEALLELAGELGVFRRALLVRLSGGAAFHEEAYRSVAARLDAEFIASWKNRGSLMAMGRLWIRNTFSNLSSLEEIAPQPLPRLGRPILVCGAGPSLEEALPLLERSRDRLFLLACDTALSPLFSAGFLPDLAVCLEGQAHNLADFVPLGGHDFPLLADLSSHPASFRAVMGTKHLSLVRIKEGAFSRRLRDLSIPALEMPPLGSVGVHALHVARRLAACSSASSVPILATGLDFAFETGKTHARGSPSLLSEERTLSRLRRWPGQIASTFRRGSRIIPREASEGQSSQGSLKTDPVLSGYAALLADEVSQPGPPVFDIRGKGLPIGAPVLDMAEALSLIESWKWKGQETIWEVNASLSTQKMSASRAGVLGRGFLRAELSRLETLESALKGRFAFSSNEMLSQIHDLDYLLWTAPDAERIRDLPQDLLNRILVETEYWIWRLGEIVGVGEKSKARDGFG